MKPPRPQYEVVHEFIERLAGDVLHPKQIDSLAHAVTGAMHAEAVSINAIGRAAARVRQVSEKHSIKQVDRLLANSKVDAIEVMRHVAPILLAERPQVAVVVEWIEFALEGHSTVAASTMTKDGAAMPLFWMTMGGKKLEKRRRVYEARVRRLLLLAVPERAEVTVLASRALGGQKRARFGLPLRDTTLSTPGRRDRMLLILVFVRIFAVVGATGNGRELDRLLRARSEARQQKPSLLCRSREYLASVARAATRDVEQTFLVPWSELYATDRIDAVL
jgi:hypothetical protein